MDRQVPAAVHALHVMTMRVQLLVSEWCVPCRGAEQVWRAVAQRKDVAFEVLDVGQPEGRAIVARLGVKTVPSTVIDGELKHLGVPSIHEAVDLVAAAPDRNPAVADSHYVGLSLEATSAWGIASSAIYLALAGTSLVFGGGIAGEAPWRAAALHAYGMGFVAFVVLGLGEHLVPRFTGAPIRGAGLAWIQFGLVHAATLMMVAGFLADVRGLSLVGGVAAMGAFGVFAWRLVPVLRHRGGVEASG
ncbi:MAG: thioredoxin family protein [Betaproteobacteria bacterium]|nr:thioredoxin family protein [Betaproteobacteria bacterium]MDE2003976.1 thioredoxin family protein [Betaproteobacteria bacterium]MDE2209009.1 thioredoxin family protein [Betaproteobacteria bacterium]MDE2359111.1 thioredoxin family protein [Betaproteobacteria bacterium]